jgi:hypothetical protein
VSTIAVVDARGYSLRHVHPTDTYPSEGATTTLLGRDYGFTWIHQAHIPTDHGFVEGTYTTRLGDAGEFSVTFPNTAGDIGPWRSRFSSDLALEFIEIYRDDVLEFVGCIQRVEIDRGSVTVSGPDAWALLRRAYERDRSWTAAPQEVATAYTAVPTVRLADDFDTLLGGWTVAPAGDSSISVDNGRLEVFIIDDSSGRVGAEYDLGAVLGERWRATVVFAINPDGVNTPGVTLRTPTDDRVVELLTSGTSASLYTRTDALANEVEVARAQSSGIYEHPRSITIERQGRWVAGYVNGILLAYAPFQSVEGVDRIRVQVAGSIGDTFYVESVTVTEMSDLLSRGSDLGDYVLPGDQPTGGLRGRYFNGADLAGLSSAIRNGRILAPDREPYGERLDASMNTSSGLSLPLQPGNSGDYFAVRWFGSVYLRGDLGNYTFETTSVVDGVRVWVGKTAWGDQLIDDWTTASGTTTGTWTAANYGSEAGWYPIVVELFVDTSAPVFRLQFTPPASTYTDPGGTSITASTKITVPSTSLSPLGCFDNRVQGASHFDLVTQAAQTFGYDITCEPMSLESGEFPGRVVPRLRVGSDTDIILAPDDSDAVEPALSPGVTLDASDQALVLIGSGAGPADGRGSQVTGEISDLAAVGDGLFALEAYVDASDIAFRDLLGARLNAELALRETPWEEVRATPRAQERRADTWPLSDTLSSMYWRPGDGVRLVVPDIAVEDEDPRQMIQVTRTFAPEGRTGTQVAFRQRPRSASRAVRGHLRSALSLGRSYQRAKVSLVGRYIDDAAVAAGGFSGYSIVPLLPGDTVVRAVARVAINSANQALDIEINGVSRASALGGAWSTIPLDIDITGYATQASSTDNRLYARLQNTGGSPTNLNLQVIVEVLR